MQGQGLGQKGGIPHFQRSLNIRLLSKLSSSEEELKLLFILRNCNSAHAEPKNLIMNLTYAYIFSEEGRNAIQVFNHGRLCKDASIQTPSNNYFSEYFL